MLRFKRTIVRRNIQRCFEMSEKGLEPYNPERKVEIYAIPVIYLTFPLWKPWILAKESRANGDTWRDWFDWSGFAFVYCYRLSAVFRRRMGDR
jgi:hypothetical protein